MSSVHAPKTFSEMITIGELVSPQVALQACNGYNNSISGNAIINLSQSLKDVFKLYTILGIKLMYVPYYNTYTAPGGTIVQPKIFFCEDKADPGTPSTITGITQMFQQDNCKVFQASRMWKHFIRRPRPYYKSLNAAYTGDPGTQIQPESKAIEWCTTSDADGDDGSGLYVEWLNSQMVVEANNGNADVKVGKLYARVYYACKDQH